MYIIHARNVNDAYRRGLRLMFAEGLETPSRNGPVLRVPEVVATQYERPHERVLFDQQRDANPFFHLFEALWMLNGGNDVATFAHILPSFAQFSDDTETFHGAYGHRWRHWPIYDLAEQGHPGLDQLACAIRMLTNDRSTRRAVIAMWDPARDLGTASKDLPCNDLINLGIRDHALDMSVTCRSNDIIYGCYGANAVHMSVLHEYLAQMIGVGIGTYTQISFDYHAYKETPYRWDKYWPLLDLDDDSDWTDTDTEWVNPYEDADDDERELRAKSLVTNRETFDKELTILMRNVRSGSVSALDGNLFDNVFLGRVAIPMHRAFEAHRQKNDALALDILARANDSDPHDNDWIMAGMYWIARRAAREMQQSAILVRAKDATR